MAKRARESDYTNEFFINNIRKISTINFTEDVNNNEISIPTEMVAKIISYLDNINDIKSCMLVSKEVRDFIFSTPEIMRKFLVKLDFEWYQALDFIQHRGKYVRHLDLNIGCQDRMHLKFILNQMPNLESLTYDSLDFAVGGYTFMDEIPDEENLAKLSKLNYLKINQCDLKDFMDSTKDVKNIEKLIVYGSDARNQDLLTDLIAQQENLKELTLTNKSFSGFIAFPVRDIVSEVKFSLKSFKLSYYNNYGFFNYTKFLQSQAESLEQLELEYTPGQEVCDVIFEDLKNLRKLTLDPYYGAPIFSDFYPHYRRESLRIYEDKYVLGVDVQKVFSRFPNLDTLKCVKFGGSSFGCFDKLTTLDIKYLNCSFLVILEFQNLKNLTIEKVSRIFFENIWQRFARNFENVENITIKSVQCITDIIHIIKNLNLFNNLKTFKFRHLKNFNLNYKMDDDEVVSKNHKFFKILIDTDEKTIKVCNYIVHNCKDILEALKENFDGFEFTEFCFHTSLRDQDNYKSI